MIVFITLTIEIVAGSLILLNASEAAQFVGQSLVRTYFYLHEINAKDRVYLFTPIFVKPMFSKFDVINTVGLN